MSMNTKETNKFFVNSYFKIIQKIFILKLKPDLDPEPELLSKTGT